MRTKDVVEGLLYVSSNREFLREALDVCHVTNMKDRNYTPMPHGEFTFLKNFKEPNIICVIEKRIHVYIIGEHEPVKRAPNSKTKYYIFDIEGDNSHLYFMPKAALIQHFRNTIFESFREFIPNPYMQRIFYIPFEYKNNEYKSSENIELETIGNMDLNNKSGSTINMFIFNRPSGNGSMLRTSDWVSDEDMHDPGVNSKSIKTTGLRIMNEILKEVK